MASHKLIIALVVSLLSPKATHGFGWNWLLGFGTTTTTATTSTSSSSGSSSGSTGTNYQISIGNRINTFANLTDYGTMISNLQINLARFNGTGPASSGTSEAFLEDAILSVAEQYRNESTNAITERLAWFDSQIKETKKSAHNLQEQNIRELVKGFANDTRTGVQELSSTIRDCLNRSVVLEDMIQSVFNRSQSRCLEAKIQRMVAVRDAASSNLTEFYENLQDLEDRLEICVDLQDDFDDDMSDFYKVACVSSILFDVQTETARLELTVEQLTAEAGFMVKQLRAGLLECVADVANYAFDASLKLRHWINVCSASNSD